MSSLRLDKESEGSGPLSRIPLQGLRIHLRRGNRPARAGGEILKKKEDSFEEEVRQTVREELTKKTVKPKETKTEAQVDVLMASGPKPIVQKDLHGNELPVETDYETKEYTIISSEKLFVRFSEESLEKTLLLKEVEQKKAILRKIRIKADREIFPGEWDRQSRLLVEAARKGF